VSKGFVFVYYDPHVTTKKSIVEFANEFVDTTVCIQQKTREELRKSYLVSTEELGTLVSMLYFREKGYVVQSPLGTCGRQGEGLPGVDDVAAWKSPVLDELREFGFVDRGCHLSELACLRWLGRVSGHAFDDGSHLREELLLTEVKCSSAQGMSNSPSKGINQLLRCRQERVASGLYICFPVINDNVEEILAEVKSRTREQPTVGAILFDDRGVYLRDSESFPADNMASAIEEYENNLKQVLLNNLYSDEIREMMDEIDMDVKEKGFGEVWTDFCGRLEKIPTRYILERVSRAVELTCPQ